MEMVQKQRLQLKMKFLLGYDMKIVVLWEDKNLVGLFFLVKEGYPMFVLMIKFKWNKFLQLNIRNKIDF